jgi:hypothetical protein
LKNGELEFLDLEKVFGPLAHVSMRVIYSLVIELGRDLVHDEIEYQAGGQVPHIFVPFLVKIGLDERDKFPAPFDAELDLTVQRTFLPLKWTYDYKWVTDRYFPMLSGHFSCMPALGLFMMKGRPT